MTKLEVDVDWPILIMLYGKVVKTHEGISGHCQVSATNIAYLKQGRIKNPGYTTAAKVINGFLNYYEGVPTINGKIPKRIKT